MPRPTPRPVALGERRRATTQLEIAWAAGRLFDENGYEATTVEQIAAAAGIGLRTFYRYCTGKDDVLTAVVSAGVRSLVEEITEQDRALPLAERAKRGLLTYIEGDPLAEARHDLAKVMLNTPALTTKWVMATREAQDALASVLASRADVGADPLHFAALSSATITAVTTALEFSIRYDRPLATCLDTCLRVLGTEVKGD